MASSGCDRITARSFPPLQRSIRINMRWLSMSAMGGDFGSPQARGIGRRQRHAGIQTRHRLQKQDNLVGAQHDGELARLAARKNNRKASLAVAASASGMPDLAPKTTAMSKRRAASSQIPFSRFLA